ncbi:hypothetical protein [Streptomyces sp. UNOC14_S4]|nr:hypothetical protein [Streptomyces sp. UNOC14_S4]MCC3766453.1 hypothetical protein [Streptomyces sp. UNOC14_S4]
MGLLLLVDFIHRLLEQLWDVKSTSKKGLPFDLGKALLLLGHRLAGYFG